MARINVEDSLFKDQRFFDLSMKIGGMQSALGAVVWAFVVAQKYYLMKETNRMIPREVWNKQGCSNLLIQVGLAKDIDGMIKVCGSDEQFAWLEQRVEAGRKGGLSGRKINERLSKEERKKRDKTRKVVSNAIQRGRIIKPKSCSMCGKVCVVEAHHVNYDEPFNITWVCKKCHHELHDMLVINEEDKRSVTSVKRDTADAKPLISISTLPLISSSKSTTPTQNTSLAENQLTDKTTEINLTKQKNQSSELAQYLMTIYPKNRNGSFLNVVTEIHRAIERGATCEQIKLGVTNFTKSNSFSSGFIMKLPNLLAEIENWFILDETNKSEEQQEIEREQAYLRLVQEKFGTQEEQIEKSQA